MYCGSLVSGLPMSLYNIYCSYRDRTGKMLGPAEALRPLISLTILFLVCTGWVLYSPSDIINRDPRLFLFFVGVVFANINASALSYGETNMFARNAIVKAYNNICKEINFVV